MCCDAIQVDALIKWLDDRGVRERHLLTNIKALYTVIVGGMEAAKAKEVCHFVVAVVPSCMCLCASCVVSFMCTNIGCAHLNMQSRSFSPPRKT